MDLNFRLIFINVESVRLAIDWHFRKIDYEFGESQSNLRSQKIVKKFVFIISVFNSHFY